MSKLLNLPKLKLWIPNSLAWNPKLSKALALGSAYLVFI